MALVLADRVQETGTVSTGTGSVNLAGAVNGYQSFITGIGNGNTTYYTIYDSTGYTWETGIGTVASGSPNTLARTTVLSNSAGTQPSKVSFSTSNTLNIWCDLPSETAILGGSGQAIMVNQTTATQNYTIATGTNGFSVGPVTTAGGVTVTVSAGQRWVVI